MAKGIEMMLKSLGLDPAVIMAKVGEFQKGIEQVLSNINTRLEAIEKTQAEIRAAQKVNYELLTEITAWKRIQVRESLLVQQPPPPLVQSPPQPPPSLPNEQ